VGRLAIEIERFYNFAKPDRLESLAREQLIEQVQYDVQKILPNHVLEVFGSERTGLALATSDIDFRLLRKDQLGVAALSKLPPEASQRSKAMRDLHLLYYSGFNGHESYLLSTLRYARYPLISLQDRKTGLDLQIVLSNDTSLSRKFIHEYTEKYPYLRPVYFVVKTMFDVRGLSDVFRGGFGSYTLFMMVVASIQHNPHPRKDAAGCLINFLKFYRDFNTTKYGLSVEPSLKFDKAEQSVVTGTAKHKLEVSTTT
jgi:non-canonical poly(A) RNA polymerase PAPD5/7